MKKIIIYKHALTTAVLVFLVSAGILFSEPDTKNILSGIILMAVAFKLALATKKVTAIHNQYKKGLFDKEEAERQFNQEIFGK
jgi:hypothetical protein